MSLVLVDQGIKAMLVNAKMRVINSGMAFGLGQAWPNFWQGVVMGLLILVIIKFRFNWQTALVTAGGLANLIDRIRWGGVVDYLTVGFGLRFNLADSLIVVGLLGLLYSFVNGSKNNL